MSTTLTPSPDATAQTLLLEEHLRRLRLPVLLARYPKVAQDATQRNLTYEGFLLALLEEELAQRDENMQKRRLAAAKFPTLKTLDQYDFSLMLFLQVKDFKPLSRPFLQLLSQPDSCYVAQTHEAHGVATAVCGSKRLVEVRRICCYAPFATPSGGNAGT